VQRFVDIAIHHALHDAGAVAQVDKHLVRLVAHNIGPATDSDSLAGQRFVQSSARMSSFQNNASPKVLCFQKIQTDLLNI
jgi:hypothetical protein